MAHEAPLFGLLEEVPQAAVELSELRRRLAGVVDRLQAGRAEEGAAEFVDTTALGPGAWARLSPAEHAALVANAPTFLDETRHPEALVFPLSALTSFPRPVLLSDGDQSAPTSARAALTVSAARQRTESSPAQSAA